MIIKIVTPYVPSFTNTYRIRICLELVLMGKILCGEERQPKADPLFISLKSISLSLNVLVIVMSFP